MSQVNNFDGLDNAENAGGAPWFQIVLPQDVDTIPDVILNSIGSAITLNGGAVAYNMKATVGSVFWNESTDNVDGVDVYTSSLTWVIPKDRNDILTYAQSINKKGVIAIVEDANGQRRLMGTKLQPATFRLVDRNTGNLDGSGRNEHRYEIVITSDAPVPFYQVTTHLPSPANGACPDPESLYIPIEVKETATGFSHEMNVYSEGTITAIDVGGLTSFAPTLNGSPVSVPFDIEEGDTLAATFDAAASTVTVLCSGTQAP